MLKKIIGYLKFPINNELNLQDFLITLSKILKDHHEQH
jgi:hypothetical protein